MLMYNILRESADGASTNSTTNLPGIVVESLRETETDLMLEAWTDKATAHVAVAVVLIYIKIMVIG